MRFGTISAFFVAATVTAGCTVSATRGYDGEVLSRGETATVRVLGPGRIEIDAPGYMLLEVQIDNPVTGEPVDSRFVSRIDRSPWLAVPAGYQCFVVRSRPVRCPPVLEEIVGIASAEVGCQSVSAEEWAEQDVCFELHERNQYHIEVVANVVDDCIGGLDVAGFDVIDVDAGKLVDRFSTNGSCDPSGRLTDRP